MQPTNPETQVAILHAPPDRRAALRALFALDERMAAVVAAARDPMIGQMRLVWWRDAVARLAEAPAPAEPLLRRIADDLLPAGAPASGLAAMIDGWGGLLPLDAVDGESVADHGAQVGEALFAIAGGVLGATPPAGAGAAWAVERLRRDFTLSVPCPSPPVGRWPSALRPLGMLAVLAGRDPAERPGSRRRLLRMVRLRLTGY